MTNSNENEVRLWQAVMTQACWDLTTKPDAKLFLTSDQQRYVEWRKWVCGAADVDEAVVVEACRKRLAQIEQEQSTPSILILDVE